MSGKGVTMSKSILAGSHAKDCGARVDHLVGSRWYPVPVGPGHPVITGPVGPVAPEIPGAARVALAGLSAGNNAARHSGHMRACCKALPVNALEATGRRVVINQLFGAHAALRYSLLHVECGNRFTAPVLKKGTDRKSRLKSVKFHCAAYHFVF